MSTTDPRTHLDYAVVDVFAERPYEGNALAIFTDARGLSTAEMQALARETNLSETTFILPENPETEAREGVRVRIFTTEEEFPFAGHPTLGTASWLRLNRPWLRPELGEATQVMLKLGVGPVRVQFAPGASLEGVQATMAQPEPWVGQEHPRELVASLLGLPVEALDGRFPVETVSTGLPFAVVPVRSVEALGALRMRHAEAADYLRETDAKFFYCVAPAEGASVGAGWRARMQFYGGEDPATGSAAGATAAWLVRHGRVRSGEPLVLWQGEEIRRPSRLDIQASTRNGKVADVFVSGRTIPVANGRFLRPR